MHKDLLVIREYTYKGIKVLVELDRVKGRVGLVEPDGEEGYYKAKEWEFAGRELKYMNGWLIILQAMTYAVEQAKIEMKKWEDEKHQDFVDTLMALHKYSDKDVADKEIRKADAKPKSVVE